MLSPEMSAVTSRPQYNPLVGADVCEETFGMPAKFFLAHARAGECPCIRVSRTFKFSLDNVQNWLHQQASTPAPAGQKRAPRKAKPAPQPTAPAAPAAPASGD